ncbi:MAG: hypothetical protein R3176_08945, partial [Woeseiaceae bacterium]|nr:hypothetical protein [Woeseiaceae bacterium]
HAAHEALQGRGGSGVDVAAALSGGLVQYTKTGRRRRNLAWPAQLKFALYWSGTPADTVAGIRRYRQRASGTRGGALGIAAERAAAAWAQADVTGILVETRRFTDELARIDTELGLGIYAAGHGALAAAASGDLVYKPCGAGGGDVGIALTTGDGLDAFSATALQHGYERLPLVLEPGGVAVAEVPA